MTNKNKELITDILTEKVNLPIYRTMLNSADFGVQKRRRLYWTTFEIQNMNQIVCSQTWNDVLIPFNEISLDNLLGDKHILNTGNQIYKESKNKAKKVYKSNSDYWTIKDSKEMGITRWQLGYHSSTLNDKSTPVTRNRNIHTCLFDYRNPGNQNEFLIRYFDGLELERLFFIPDGWVSDICSKSRTQKLMGNTVVVKVIEFILQSY